MTHTINMLIVVKHFILLVTRHMIIKRQPTVYIDLQKMTNPHSNPFLKEDAERALNVFAISDLPWDRLGHQRMDSDLPWDLSVIAVMLTHALIASAPSVCRCCLFLQPCVYASSL